MGIKTSLIIAGILILGIQVNAQEEFGKTYTISGSKSTNASAYRAAVEQAKWDCYRMQDQRRKLNFDDGTVVELFSVSEMNGHGNPISVSCLTDPTKLPATTPIYKLAPNGAILELHDDRIKKEQQ